MNDVLRVIISGGGTGGHIFPAVSIANEIRAKHPNAEILFVGAEGRMEMQRVPAAGYNIKGLPIAGFDRKNLLKNIPVLFKILKSRTLARQIVKEFAPQVAVGVGGYASGPTLNVCEAMGIPTLLQEQNSYAGVTNKLLAKKARRICVAYDGMERFFPADKIVMTGNPIRKEIVPATSEMRKEGIEYYKLTESKRHILVTGGSLGSGTLNKAMKKWIGDGCPGGENIEILWQCGKYYKAGTDEFMAKAKAEGLGGNTLKFIHYSDFIGRMDLAYAMADVVISRSGASTVSELCAAHKAAVFVPSPNVAEDHQTHNAMALVRKDAAMLVKDAEAPEKLLAAAISLVNDNERLEAMQKNIAKLALTNAAGDIAEYAYKLIEKQ